MSGEKFSIPGLDFEFGPEGSIQNVRLTKSVPPNGGTDPGPGNGTDLLEYVREENWFTPQMIATPFKNDAGEDLPQPTFNMGNGKDYLVGQFKKEKMLFKIDALNTPAEGYRVELSIQAYAAKLSCPVVMPDGSPVASRAISFLIPDDIIPPAGEQMDFGGGHLYIEGGDHKFAAGPKWTYRDPNRPKIVIHVGDSELETQKPKNIDGREFRLHFGFVYKYIQPWI